MVVNLVPIVAKYPPALWAITRDVIIKGALLRAVSSSPTKRPNETISVIKTEGSKVGRLFNNVEKDLLIWNLNSWSLILDKVKDWVP